MNLKLGHLHVFKCNTYNFSSAWRKTFILLDFRSDIVSFMHIWLSRWVFLPNSHTSEFKKQNSLFCDYWELFSSKWFDIRTTIENFLFFIVMNTYRVFELFSSRETKKKDFWLREVILKNLHDEKNLRIVGGSKT